MVDNGELYTMDASKARRTFDGLMQQPPTFCNHCTSLRNKSEPLK